MVYISDAGASKRMIIIIIFAPYNSNNHDSGGWFTGTKMRDWGSGLPFPFTDIGAASENSVFFHDYCEFIITFLALTRVTFDNPDWR